MALKDKILPFITILAMTIQIETKIVRNTALMAKMVEHQRRNSQYKEELTNTEENPHNEQDNSVMKLMQRVLCKNFPMIPCKLIQKDAVLQKLIDKSIQQINDKKRALQNKPKSLLNLNKDIHPVVTDNDLSSFLSVKNTGFFLDDNNIKKKRMKKNTAKHANKKYQQDNDFRDTINAVNNQNVETAHYGRKKIRTFYPHKVKQKQKAPHNFNLASNEELSMSEEVPDMTAMRRHQHIKYKVGGERPDVWKIDYMKHGEPSFDVFHTDNDDLRGKIIRPGPSMLPTDSVLEQSAGKKILHPDVYIKKSINSRKKSLNIDMNMIEK